MGRPSKDASGPATETLTLRLTKEDRRLLDQLVALRSAELADEAVEVSATSYVRAFIRREAKAKGIMEGQPATPAPVPAPAAAPPERSADDVRAMLDRAVKKGAVQTRIAESAGVDRGDLSRFRTKQKPLSPLALAKLAAFLEKSA